MRRTLLQIFQRGVGAHWRRNRPANRSGFGHGAQLAFGNGELFLRLVQCFGLAPDASQNLVFFTLERHDVVAQAEVFHLAALCLDLLGELRHFVTDLCQCAAAGFGIGVIQLAGVGNHQFVDQRGGQRSIGSAGRHLDHVGALSHGGQQTGLQGLDRICAQPVRGITLRVGHFVKRRLDQRAAGQHLQLIQQRAWRIRALCAAGGHRRLDLDRARVDLNPRAGQVNCRARIAVKQASGSQRQERACKNQKFASVGALGGRRKHG